MSVAGVVLVPPFKFYTPTLPPAAFTTSPRCPQARSRPEGCACLLSRALFVARTFFVMHALPSSHGHARFLSCATNVAFRHTGVLDLRK
ncbi:hypothetical protein CROQUDRAFT_101466 [Cronartium quercuum f. sp. fusiforme G11]|uniref:Uncharacterized protein n=1 Tax=Cronartium quercuum f. sp. fusiforme G11 TaxID=708437 RepID=A0A9P6T5F6_9BASI|nr:hypothetical protein CROQUDRAFT_101466 [Cronartium quercuum f. sp. fusiforme G11]